MTPEEREALKPLARDQITAEIADMARKAVASHTAGMGHSVLATAGIYAAYTIIRERQLLAKMSLISSLELTLSNSTNLNVMQMERIEALEASGKWISVDQELPPVYKHVAVILYGGVTAGFMSHDGWFVLSESGYQTHNIKLWQPLPAAPTEPTPEESE